MAGEKGIAFVLKAGDFATGTQIACQRTTSFSINGTTVDVTNKDSAGFMTLLADAGTTNASASIEGVYLDDTTITNLFDKCVAKSIDQYTIVYANGDYIEFTAQVPSFENSGEKDGETTYSASFESSGAFSRTSP